MKRDQKVTPINNQVEHDDFSRMIHQYVAMLLSSPKGCLLLATMFDHRLFRFEACQGWPFLELFYVSRGCAQCGVRGRPLPANGIPWCSECQAANPEIVAEIKQEMAELQSETKQESQSRTALWLVARAIGGKDIPEAG